MFPKFIFVSVLWCFLCVMPLSLELRTVKHKSLLILLDILTFNYC